MQCRYALARIRVAASHRGDSAYKYYKYPNIEFNLQRAISTSRIRQFDREFILPRGRIGCGPARAATTHSYHIDNAFACCASTRARTHMTHVPLTVGRAAS